MIGMLKFPYGLKPKVYQCSYSNGRSKSRAEQSKVANSISGRTSSMRHGCPGARERSRTEFAVKNLKSGYLSRCSAYPCFAFQSDKSIAVNRRQTDSMVERQSAQRSMKERRLQLSPLPIRQSLPFSKRPYPVRQPSEGVYQRSQKAGLRGPHRTSLRISIEPRRLSPEPCPARVRS